MQITYLEAYLHVDQLSAQRIGGFVAWIARMAENNLRDAVRGLEALKRPHPDRRWTPSPDEDSHSALLASLGVTTSTPSRKLVRREAIELLGRAIERLPKSYQEVVRGAELEGCAVSDVAATMGKSVGAVLMIRARARDRLAHLLRPAMSSFPPRAR